MKNRAVSEMTQGIYQSPAVSQGNELRLVRTARKRQLSEVTEVDSGEQGSKRG